MGQLLEQSEIERGRHPSLIGYKQDFVLHLNDFDTITLIFFLNHNEPSRAQCDCSVGKT